MTRDTAWVVRRTTVSSTRLPRFGERLELRTACSGMAKSVAERTTTIRGDDGAALEAIAIWVHLDPRLRRPARLPAEFIAAYGESAAGHRPRSSLRHPPQPPEGAERSEWSFAQADIDRAGHVNNTMYWRIAEEAFGLAPIAATAVALEAEYRAGIGAGIARVDRAGQTLWISDRDGTLAATIAVEPR